MKFQKPSDLIRWRYGASKNPLADDIIDYGWIVGQEIAYEKAIGVAITRGHYVVGVTVVEYALGPGGCSILSKSFSGLGMNEQIRRAEEYIESLKGL